MLSTIEAPHVIWIDGGLRLHLLHIQVPYGNNTEKYFSLLWNVMMKKTHVLQRTENLWPRNKTLLEDEKLKLYLIGFSNTKVNILEAQRQEAFTYQVWKEEGMRKITVSMCIKYKQTFKAIGSRLKSQTSPTESSRASSILFSWDAYSSRNFP